MSRADDPSRRILQSFNRGQEIMGFDTDLTPNDLKLLLPAIGLCLAYLIVIPGQYLGVVLALCITTLLIAGMLIHLSPTYRSAPRWLFDIIRYRAMNKMMTTHQNPESISRLTDVDELLPTSNAVRRSDGTLVGYLEVKASSMALATNDQWESAAKALGDVINTTEYPFQIYTTSVSVSADDIADQYAGRMDDPDVREDDDLQNIVEYYHNNLPAEFRRRGTSMPRYYVAVAVSPEEVGTDSGSMIGDLSGHWLYGRLVRRLGLHQFGQTSEEVRVEQKQTLNTRLADLQDQLDSISGLDVERLDIDSIATLLYRYWTGDDSADGENLSAHTMPVVVLDEET